MEEEPKPRKPWELSPAEIKAAVNVTEALRKAAEPRPESPKPAPPKPKPRRRTDVRESSPAVPEIVDPPNVPLMTTDDPVPRLPPAMTVHNQLFRTMTSTLPESLGPDSVREDRVLFAVAAMAQGCWAAWIVQTLQENCAISRPVAIEDVADARRAIAEGMAVSRQGLRLESAAFYSGIAADVTKETRDRIAARKEVDRLYGLHPPAKSMQVVEMVDGERTAASARREAFRSVLKTMTVPELEALADLQASVRKRLENNERPKENGET